MSLHIVSTPIGNDKDISKRALEVIEQSELIIGEERKVTSRFLKQYKLTGRPIELLNEHSDKEDLEFLLNECKNKKVALISDCGTPGFCDPGALLVQKCRQAQVPVVPVPGASSLMAFLAVCGHRLDHFLFRGFIPGNNEKRQKAWNELKKEKRPFILMDTPYRLTKLLQELKINIPRSSAVIGYKLTQEEEEIFEGSPKALLEKFRDQKGEFILLILPF